MRPRISVLTLGVFDLQESLIFYRDILSLQTEGIVGNEFDHGAVAFFDLFGDIKLAIFAQSNIAHDFGLVQTPISPTSFTIGHNVREKDEVDLILRRLAESKATIIKSAQDTFYGGYAGYFTDPNGHLWEIVWNPQMLPKND